MDNYINEKIIYLQHLIGKIMKVLYIYEEKEALTSKIYLGGLLINIDSANRMFKGIFVEILIKLNEINFDTMNHKEIRKRVLEAVNMADKMLKEF